MKLFAFKPKKKKASKIGKSMANEALGIRKAKKVPKAVKLKKNPTSEYPIKKEYIPKAKDYKPKLDNVVAKVRSFKLPKKEVKHHSTDAWDYESGTSEKAYRKLIHGSDTSSMFKLPRLPKGM